MYFENEEVIQNKTPGNQKKTFRLIQKSREISIPSPTILSSTLEISTTSVFTHNLCLFPFQLSNHSPQPQVSQQHKQIPFFPVYSSYIHAAIKTHFSSLSLEHEDQFIFSDSLLIEYQKTQMPIYMQILLVMFNRCISRFGGFLITDTLSCLNSSSPNKDLSYGFWLLRCSTGISHMLFLIFIFISLLIRFLGEFRGKSADLKYGFCSGFDFSGICCLKILSWKVCLYRFVQSSSSTLEGEQMVKEEENQDHDGEGNVGLEVLKEAIEFEKERANAANWELEQERMSASSAAEEAMSMILRLQREKNEIEMEANQYKRLVEQKQRYDDEVIESLRWIVLKHESERSILLNHLKLCKEKLEHYDGSDPQLEELDEILNCSYSTFEEDDEVTCGSSGGVVSSL